MKILVTGSAGFIGSEVIIKLLERGEKVVGVDNHNDYYNTQLKEDRIQRFVNHENYEHIRSDISCQKSVQDLFTTFEITRVVNLAAQAGVRYAAKNPASYITSNLVGFANILESCKVHKISHLVYASSSSVYGANSIIPFSEHHNVNHPVSLYAATKRANELMAHSYSHIYNLPTSGLRFFTVYGPWGRPDMSLYEFTRLILKGEEIPVFNSGKHKRDFTYISDIVDGVLRVLDNPAFPNNDWDSNDPDPATSSCPWKIYNIGNNKPVELLDFIKAIENALGKKAKLSLQPMQVGDVVETFADISDLRALGYCPKVEVNQGVQSFVDWYMKYHNV